MKIRLTSLRVVGTFVVATSLLVISATAQTAYESLVLGDNPLAFYALNPAVDGTDTAPDLSGNGNDGDAVDIAAASGPSAYITNAANFDGTAAIDLSQGGNPGLLVFSGPITLEAWCQPSSTGLFGDILAKGYDSVTYQEIVIRVNGGYGSPGPNYYGSSGSVGENAGAQTTNWTYIVLSSDGTNCTLYENGALVSQGPDTSGSQAFDANNDDWMIGDGSSAGTGRTFNGNISEVALYSHGLSAAQVKAHYLMGMYGSTNFSVTPRNLGWSASGNSGVWDPATSANWVNLANSQTTVFDVGDDALFNDTAGEPTSVTVNGNVYQSQITVNSSANNFTLGGPGAITGPGGLLKEGSSTLTINSAAEFTGPAIISGGVVYAGNNSLASAASITVTNNATLDIAGSSLSASKPITISGSGVDGEGAIYNSYGNYPGETIAVTLTGNAKFGGSQRWDMDSSSITGPYDLLVDWSSSGGYGQWNGVTFGPSLAEVTVTNSSTLGITGMDNSCQNTATLFNFGPNCQLVAYGGGFNGSLSMASGANLVIYNGNLNLGGSTLHFYGGSTAYLYSSGIAMTGNSLIFEDGAVLQTYYNGGNNPVANQVTFNGVAHFILGDHTMTFNNVVSGPGGFVVDYYNNEIVMEAANTYTGPTIIGSSGNSPAVGLIGTGSISDSSLIFFGGNDPTVMRMDVSGRSDQTFTLASGQTLQGVGGVNGSLVVSAGATISPGGTNTTIGITTGSSAVGTIAASSTVALDGTTVIKLDGPGTNDMVEAAGNLTLGGTLSLENISGNALTAGNSFTIFTAANINGSFASITPATPGAGLAWNTSQLGSGIISVQSAPTGPTITSTEVSNGKIIFSGTGGTDGGVYYLLTTTNLAAGSWTPIATNNYNANGTFNVTTAITPGVVQQYFKLQN